MQLFLIVQYHKAVRESFFRSPDQPGTAVIIAAASNRFILPQKTEKNVLFRNITAYVRREDFRFLRMAVKPSHCLPAHQGQSTIVCAHIFCRSEQKPVGRMKTKREKSRITGIKAADQQSVPKISGRYCIVFPEKVKKIRTFKKQIRAGLQDVGTCRRRQSRLCTDDLTVDIIQGSGFSVNNFSSRVGRKYVLVGRYSINTAAFPG